MNFPFSAQAFLTAFEVYIGNMVQGKSASLSYKTKKQVRRPEEEWIRGWVPMNFPFSAQAFLTAFTFLLVSRL